jgi:hypothetical protein
VQSIELYRKLFENFALESSLGNAAASRSEKSVSRSEPSG